MRANFLSQVIKLLNKDGAILFDIYKNTTISRRVKKRMDALNIASENEYLKLLKKEQNELEILKQAIFINVSYFFRDKSVFNYLEKQILPEILKDNTKPIKRFWVAGCSTGEEVFSLLILILEIIEKYKIKNCSYKILASDIDNLALNKARLGCYTSTDIKQIPTTLLGKYFTKLNDQYYIIKSLRKDVIFAKHDLYVDPPFGAIDLLLCRNVLIYIKSSIQEAILKKINFSLNNFGYLLLGSSESPIIIKKHFKIIDNQLKVFKKINAEDENLLQIGKPQAMPATPKLEEKNITTKMGKSEINYFKKYISEKHQPAIIIVYSNLNAAYITKPALHIFNGNKDVNKDISIKEILPADLCVIIKTAINTIESKDKAYLYPKYVLPNNIAFDIICEKIEVNFNEKKSYSIFFKPLKDLKIVQALNINKINQILKKELETTEINLKESIQALEKSNQNFQSYNEELQSTNEEYLSVNEELQSINIEYQNSINNLSQANNYLDSLMESTQIATLFLDHKLKIKKFTKPTTKLLNITEKDVDRPVHHFTHSFINDNWQKLIKNFLKNRTPIDEEFLDLENNNYLLKVRNLKLIDSDKPGASISFININKLKIAEQEIKENELLFRSIFEESTNGIIIYDVKNLKAIQVNKTALKLFGYSKKEFLSVPTLSLYSFYKKNKLSIKEEQNLIYQILTEVPEKKTPITITLSNNKLLKVETKIIQLSVPYDNFCIHILSVPTVSLINDESLLKNNSLVRQLFNTLKEAIILFERKTNRIVNINNAQEQLLGYSKKEYQKILGIDLLADIQQNNVRKEVLYEQRKKKNFKLKAFTDNWILKRKNKTTFEATVETKRLDAPFEGYSIKIIKPVLSISYNEAQNLDSFFDIGVENNSLFFVHLKLNGLFLSGSNSFLKFTGYTKKELLNLKLTQIIIPKTNLLHKTKNIKKSKVRKLITKNNEIKYCNFYTKRIYANKKAIGYKVLITECTDEILQQNTLLKQLNQFEKQATQSPLVITTIDENLNFLYVNNKFCKLFGYTKNLTYNLNVKDIIYFDFLKVLKEQLYRLKTNKQKNITSQYTFTTKNGVPIYCKTFLTLNRNTVLSKTNTFDMLFMNITDEVVKQQQVNELKNKYESIFNDSLFAHAIFDTSSKLQTVNAKTADIFGYTISEFKKIKFSDICYANDKKLMVKQMNSMIAGRINSFKTNIRFYHKNGQIIYTEIYANAIYENDHLKSIYHAILDVTKQTILTEKLINNERRYKDLFYGATYGVLIFDSEEEKLLEVNKKLLQIIGCKSKEELLKQNYLNFLEPVHIDGNFIKDVIYEVKEKLKNNKQFSMVFKLKKSNQFKVIYVNASFYPLPSQNGTIFSLILQDVDKHTKIKASLNNTNLTLIRTKNELRETKIKYNKLFNNKAIPIVIINSKLELIEVNRAFAKLISFAKNEIIGKPITRFIQTNDLKKINTFFNAALKNNIFKNTIITKLQKTNTSLVSVKLHLSELRPNNKLTQNLIVTVIDLSLISQISEQLFESKNYLKAVLDNSFGFNCQLDLDGNLLLDNKTSKLQNNFYGSKTNLIKKPVWKSSWLNGLPEEQEKLKNHIKLVSKNKTTIIDQVLYRKSDHKYGYLKYAIKYIKVYENEDWLSLENVDITDLIESKTKLANTINKLESYIKSNLEFEKFAFIVSHDLKEPIRNIMSFTQLLGIKLQNNKDKELNDYLSFILDSTHNLNNLVNGILEYSKFEKQSTKLTTISVKLLLKECLKQFHTEINDSNIKIKILKTPTKVIGDELQLLELFKNIISNAIKFSDTKRQTQIIITGTENDSEYKFEIKDNGIGIPKKYYKKIFLVLKKLHTKKDYKGTGFGLKLAQRIVHNHKGEIWVESKYGEGSTFHFTLKKHTIS